MSGSRVIVDGVCTLGVSLMGMGAMAFCSHVAKAAVAKGAVVAAAGAASASIVGPSLPVLALGGALICSLITAYTLVDGIFTILEGLELKREEARLRQGLDQAAIEQGLQQQGQQQPEPQPQQQQQQVAVPASDAVVGQPSNANLAASVSAAQSSGLWGSFTAGVRAMFGSCIPSPARSPRNS